MKTKFIVLATFVLVAFFTISTYAADNLKQQYLDKRYRGFNCPNGSTYYLDIAQVSSVIKDSTTLTAWKFWSGTHKDPSNIITNYQNKWWLKMANGNIQYLENCSDIASAWVQYRDFLKSHPEFINIQ